MKRWSWFATLGVVVATASAWAFDAADFTALGRL